MSTTARARAEIWEAWVAAVATQGKHAPNDGDNAEAKGDNTWVNDKDKDKIGNVCVAVVLPMCYHGRFQNTTPPHNSIN